MADFLRFGTGRYHFGIIIPSDLQNAIPASEILKSLRTKDEKVADIAAINCFWESKICTDQT